MSTDDSSLTEKELWSKVLETGSEIRSKITDLTSASMSVFESFGNINQLSQGPRPLSRHMMNNLLTSGNLDYLTKALSSESKTISDLTGQLRKSNEELKKRFPLEDLSTSNTVGGEASASPSINVVSPGGQVKIEQDESDTSRQPTPGMPSFFAEAFYSLQDGQEDGQGGFRDV